MRSMIVALAILTGAGAADAAKVIVTHAGHIVGGTDDHGLFGTPGADMAGAAFTAVYTMDLSQTVHGVGSGGWYTEGYAYGPETVSLTINGVTQTYSDPADGYMSRRAYLPGYSSTINFVSDTFDDSANGGNTYFVNQLGSNNPMFADLDITTPFSYTAQPGDFALGSFYHYYEAFGWTDEHVESTGLIAGGVPEPASWALMLGGFGLVGGALRARRRLALVA